MNRSHTFPTAFLVLTIIIVTALTESAHSIAPEQIQKICACTNSTKDECNNIITSNPALKSAPDAKSLIPLVMTNLTQMIEKTLNYAKSLVSTDVKDPKLKTLYEGYASLFVETNEMIHAAAEAAKAGNLAKVAEEVDECEFNVQDCLIGPRELGVKDPSDIGNYCKNAKAWLDILTCVVQFAT